MLIETTNKYAVETEEAAKEMIERYRKESAEGGYIIKKAGYTRKDKKAKGEIVDTVFEVVITQVFGTLWGI